jgi:hypothetical protein
MIKLRPLIQLAEITNFLRQKIVILQNIEHLSITVKQFETTSPHPASPPSQNNGIKRGYRIRVVESA